MGYDLEELAIQKDEEVVEYIYQLETEIGVYPDFVDYFAENGVVFVIEPGISDIVYSRRCPRTLKVGNVFVDMKKTLEAMLQIISGVQKPESVFQAVQMILMVILSIKDVVNVSLPKISSEIIIILLTNEGYRLGVEEEKLYYLVNEYNKQHNLELISEEEIMQANDFLNEYEVIEINEGRIFLKERVFGKDFV